MKGLLMMMFLGCSILTTNAQSKQAADSIADKSKEVLIAEAACGQCMWGMPGESCDLAIRLSGKAYFADGTGIDSHGDAHAKDGFCNAIRKAKVQGEIVNNRFKATYFQLVPEPLKKNNAD
jgi:hypothetical protein